MIARILVRVGVSLYILSSFAGMGVLVDFVYSVFKWDFSPWWWFPACLAGIWVLVYLAGIFMMLGEKAQKSAKLKQA